MKTTEIKKTCKEVMMVIPVFTIHSYSGFSYFFLISSTRLVYVTMMAYNSPIAREVATPSSMMGPSNLFLVT
jgi:hypothetical protein